MTTKLSATVVAVGQTVQDLANSPSALQSGRTREYGRNYGGNYSLNATSTPALDIEPLDLSGVIPAGLSLDYDFTAAPRVTDINQNLDMTNRRLVFMQLTFAATNNVAGMRLTGQGANAYPLFGAAATEVVFGPGQVISFGSLAAPSIDALVAAGAKDIRFSGAENDAFTALFYFGLAGV